MSIENILLENKYDYGCCKNVKIYGLEESIKRAKYPMSTNIDKTDSFLTNGIKSLAQCKMGEGHDNWLNGVVVQFDLSFSIKAWTEAERYHFLDFVSSQSTMHRITKFDLDSSYNEFVDRDIIKILKNKVKSFNEKENMLKEKVKLHAEKLKTTKEADQELLGEIETLKEALNTIYLNILYSNPCGFVLTAGMTTNYRQLKTIYQQRKNHRLPEWREFCKWIEGLPHSDLITGV